VLARAVPGRCALSDSDAEPCGGAGVTAAGGVAGLAAQPAAADYPVAGVSGSARGLLRDGTVRDYAELARLGGVSRARMTQIMGLRNLAPAIQERILGLTAASSPADVINERLVREVAQRWDWREQMRMWEKLACELGSAERRQG
jgi:hypothetical protein